MVDLLHMYVVYIALETKVSFYGGIHAAVVNKVRV